MDRLGIIGSVDQSAVLAEPHRLAVLRRIMAGPATISQIAQSFGTYPAWARHHVMRLQAAGLVELCETRTTRNYTEKFYRASAPAYCIHAIIAPDAGERRSIVALGSHDLALEALASLVNARPGDVDVVPAAIGSLDGLVALRQGLADVAGCHLLDVDTGVYNLPFVRHLFPDRPVLAVTLVEREQGLMLAPGNPRGISGLEDLARTDVRLANRNPGSGTRLWLDRRLREIGLEPTSVSGYEDETSTHTDAAAAVARGQADVAIGIQAAAEADGLLFVPLFQERYDLVVAADRADDPRLQPLLNEMTSGRFRKAVRLLGGYEVRHTGDQERVTA